MFYFIYKIGIFNYIVTLLVNLQHFGLNWKKEPCSPAEVAEGSQKTVPVPLGGFLNTCLALYTATHKRGLLPSV